MACFYATFTYCKPPSLIFRTIILSFLVFTAPPNPDLLRVANPAAQLNLMQGDSDSYSSCKVGDKVYSNGETFNPQIGTLGSYGNVVCTCRVRLV